MKIVSGQPDGLAALTARGGQRPLPSAKPQRTVFSALRREKAKPSILAKGGLDEALIRRAAQAPSTDNARAAQKAQRRRRATQASREEQAARRRQKRRGR
jgi:hypothetical protein